MQKVKIHVGTTVEYHTPELLFLGQSGQPYRGSVTIKFTSLGESFDTRDFKIYLTSLRGQTLYAEDIAYEIYNTVTESIRVEDLGVIVDLSARGGIQQRISYGESLVPTQKSNIFQIG